MMSYLLLNSQLVYYLQQTYYTKSLLYNILPFLLCVSELADWEDWFGHEYGSLYYSDNGTLHSGLAVIPPFDTLLQWYHRLGHPSSQKLHQLSSLLSLP